MVWTDIGTQRDFPEGVARELVVGDRMVAVFNVAGTLYAMDGVCPHQGGPLGQGQLSGCILTCPWHGWQFDVRDGQSLLSPAVKHPVMEVRTSDTGVVQVWVETEG